MQTDWEGCYLDGKTAARQRAAVRLLRTRLEISPENGPVVWWPYGEIRQTQGFYAGQEIRLERGGEISEVVLIRDPAFLTSLHRVAPETAGRFHDPGRRRMRIGLTALAALAAVCVAAALYRWGIPGMASVVASHVPVSWEEHLGRTVSDQLAPMARRCTERTRLDAIQAITAALTSTIKTPYTFRLVVLDTPSVNALATPGGYIVVFRGLLERTQSAEELAGVLAHEFQHVRLQHATRALLRHASTGILLAAVSGDVSGAMTYGLEGARVLAELRYSRQDEEEADREGYRMLMAAGVDPAGMMRFFETLQKETGRAPTLPSYLSTHPSTEGRIERLRSLGAAARPAAGRLLPGLDWRDVRDICGATSPLRP
jgi:predicted Zn-dependent protease